MRKTCKEIGDLQNAGKYFRRAYELKPGSSKYRKAYYSLKGRIVASPGQGTEEDQAD